MQKTTLWGGITDLPLLRTLLTIRRKSQEPSFREVMDSFILLAYASLAASRTFLQRLLACLNFTLESEDFSLWYKRKKWFLWTMAAVQAAENHGDEWGLTLHFWWGIYASISPCTQSNLSNDHLDCPNQHNNSHKQCDEMGNPNGGQVIVKQILASEERKKYRRAGLWEPQSRMRV